MGRRRKQYDDDDGRTIVDMSQVTGPSTILPHRDAGRESGREPLAGGQHGYENRNAERPGTEMRPWESASLTAKERLMCVLGAMKATLLIGFAYLAGFALLLLFLFWLWD